MKFVKACGCLYRKVKSILPSIIPTIFFYKNLDVKSFCALKDNSCNFKMFNKRWVLQQKERLCAYCSHTFSISLLFQGCYQGYRKLFLCISNDDSLVEDVAPRNYIYVTKSWLKLTRIFRAIRKPFSVEHSKFYRI